MENYKELTDLVSCYWNSRAKDFSVFRKDEYHSVQFDKWALELKEKLGANRNAKVLDVGCGSGFLSAILATLGYEVTGVDLSEEMIEQSKAFVASEGLQVEFYQMNALELDFPDESFDFVLSRNLTWTLPNLEQAYKEWLRVLKKGGKIINFDAEYAKDFAVERVQKHAAHVDCSEEQNRQCAQIYDMLDISKASRPAYDGLVLTKLEAEFNTDETVSSRIYDDPASRYYIPCNMFCVMAQKKKV